MKHYFGKGNKGFSILEFIVVVAIVVTLSGLFIPQFMQYVSGKRETACLENRDAVVNLCEKLVYSGVPLNKLQDCVADITTGGSANTWAIPDEYAEAIKAHWKCPEDGSTLSVSVDLSNNIITCECNQHSQEVVADMTTWGGQGLALADPGFAVPTVAIPTPGPTPTIPPTPSVTPSPTPHISDGYWPDITDSRWDAAGRFSSAFVEVRVPSGKFAMKTAGATTTYYVLINKNSDPSGKFKIQYEHCFDPSTYMFGGSGGTECVIATNGTEYTYDSLLEAVAKTPSLIDANSRNKSKDEQKFSIAGGTIFTNEAGKRYIYFHQGAEYTTLPTVNNSHNGNKCGNWYLMADTDEI